ncbi:MAG: regulatory protein RecX [Microbacter sp.]
MDPFTNLMLKKAAAFASRRETTRWEITVKLKTWGGSAEQIDTIASYLEKENYINEERFCKSFINDKLRFDKWGRIKIAKALQIKHIPSATFQPLLDLIDKNEYAQLLTELLDKKAPHIKARNKIEKQGKLINFAIQRGFEFEIIEPIISSKNYE